MRAGSHDWLSFYLLHKPLFMQRPATTPAAFLSLLLLPFCLFPSSPLTWHCIWLPSLLPWASATTVFPGQAWLACHFFTLQEGGVLPGQEFIPVRAIPATFSQPVILRVTLFSLLPGGLQLTLPVRCLITYHFLYACWPPSFSLPYALFLTFPCACLPERWAVSCSIPMPCCGQPTVSNAFSHRVWKKSAKRLRGLLACYSDERVYFLWFLRVRFYAASTSIAVPVFPASFAVAMPIVVRAVRAGSCVRRVV